MILHLLPGQTFCSVNEFSGPWTAPVTASCTVNHGVWLNGATTESGANAKAKANANSLMAPALAVTLKRIKWWKINDLWLNIQYQ